MAIFLNDRPDVGEALDIALPALDLRGETHMLPTQLGITCWVREAPKGSLYRYLCGLQFRYANDFEREQVKEYITYVREKYKV